MIMPGKKSAHQASPPLMSGNTPCTIQIPRQRIMCTIAAVCILLELLFVWLDYTFNYSYWTELGPIRRLFNITREDGMASWFGVTQTFLAALTLWAIHLTESKQGCGKWTKRGWLVLAIFFTYMAVDDGSDLHERMGSAFKEIQEREINAEGAQSLLARAQATFPSYSWQIIYAPVFLSLGAFIFIFLWLKLETKQQRIALIFAFCLLGMALVLDFFEGLEPDHRWNIYTALTNKYQMNVFTITHFREMAYESCRHFSKSIEEFMEMLAMTTLWMIFLGHLGLRTPQINLKFDR